MATIIHTDGTQQEVAPANGTDFSLVEVQQIVGGRVELVALSDRRYLLLNEDGKLDELAVNLSATRLYLLERDGFDFIAGDVLVCACGEFR